MTFKAVHEGGRGLREMGLDESFLAAFDSKIEDSMNRAAKGQAPRRPSLLRRLGSSVSSSDTSGVRSQHSMK
jgi:hypothetical protein